MLNYINLLHNILNSNLKSFHKTNEIRRIWIRIRKTNMHYVVEIMVNFVLTSQNEEKNRIEMKLHGEKI